MSDWVYEGIGTGEFILSEAQGYRSRETITLEGGSKYVAGSVLGKVTVGAAAAAAKVGNAGNGTVGTITVGAAKPGVYVVTFIEPATNGGAFQMEDPDGVNAGTGAVGAAFTGGGLTFTIADGAADFAAGDQFKIVVAAGSNRLKLWNPANIDGSETAVAVLYDNVDATAGHRPAVIFARDCEVNGQLLTFFSGATDNQKAAAAAQLAALGTIVR
ncbi:head decoration protein [Azospirillum sp. A26]|uniref:head decoration protein n=1 Tax=Azospirillum sp. A26 TaxID=3160607 RepID=UPI00366A71C4